MWLPTRELVRIQKVSKLFYSQAIPIVFFRSNTLLPIFKGFIHWFEEQSNDLFIYDINKKKQVKLYVDMVVPSGCRTIATTPKHILLIGGKSQKITYNQTWLFKVTQKVVTTNRKADMIIKRRSMAICIDKRTKEVYVFGGIGNGGNYLDHCEKYSVEND